MITIIQEIALPETLKPDELRAAVRCTLAHQGIEQDRDISIVITNDLKIRELNAKYRGIDQPTDVLAFPIQFGESISDEFLAQEMANNLGDVVLSSERAEAQIKSKPHDIKSELLLLVVHGVLHLLGHDHADQKNKQTMWAAQQEILAEIGLNLELPE